MTGRQRGSVSVPPSSLSDVLQDLDQLATISAPGQGVTRLAYSNEDGAAREWFRQRAAEMGLEYQLDHFGNSFAWSADHDDASCVLVGSHLDSVIRGGRYDGALGVAAAFEVLRRVQQQRPRQYLGVAAFACEESVRFGIGAVGSRALVGDLSAEELDSLTDEAGTSLRTFREQSELLGRTAVALPPVRAFLEIHVDQNGTVAQSEAAIGLVSGIAGVTRTSLTWRGHATHSGAHRRMDRCDALLAAAAFLTRIDAHWAAAEADGHSVAITVGKFNCFPNQPNTVVGQVDAILDIRAIDQLLLESVSASLTSLAKDIAEQTGVEVVSQTVGSIPPTPMDSEVVIALQEAAARQRLGVVNTPSMSGHDAGILAPHMPVGMVFVSNPSGVSHSPEESFDERSLEAAIAVLAEAIVQICDQT